MADDADSKSVAGNRVRVQVPLPAVNNLRRMSIHLWVLIFLQEIAFCKAKVIREDAAYIFEKRMHRN